MSASTQINNVVSSGFFYLRQIKSIRRCLPADAAKSLVNAFVVSRRDYCNSLYAQVDRIQSVFNGAARLIFGASRFSLVTPLLRDRLYWLCCPERICYKLCVTVFNPLTAISRSSGYKLFVTRCRQPAFRIEHYMQNGAVNRCSG